MKQLVRWAFARPGAATLLVLGLALASAAPGAVGPTPFEAQLADTDVTDGTGVAPPPPAAITQPVAATAASSAVTVQGTGEFAGLKVTVGQTKDLINQAVNLSWTGGRPTGSGGFGANYLQIMQCWGDGASGPERTQCEFGGNVAFDTRGGQNTSSRHLSTGLYKDPKDPLLTQAAPGVDVYVPFVSVTGVTVSGISVLKNQFYDNTTTNELVYARTRGDGTGEALFETQTYREAPGLGCGKVITTGANTGQPRSCWLVIVPRGSIEVDGTAPSGRLDTSPLSTTNWANRLVVSLQFVAVGAVCPISAAQKQTTGVESATELVLRLQPALCRNNGPVYGYAQSPDATAERTLVTDDPGMVFVNQPAPTPPEDRLYTYAPIALSGLVIAVSVDRQPASTAPAAEQARAGEPMTTVNLTPRLVAKLLTQSYRNGAPGLGRAAYLEKNVDNIAQDQDFLAVNPDFKSTQYRLAIDLLTPLGLAYSTSMLWEWIGSDQEAADFLAGLPDPWGMRVNPFYQGTSTARRDFPKVDPYCADIQLNAPPLCTLDEHPYTQDLHDAARSAARGDPLSRTFWDANGIPPAWKKNQLQLSGGRQILALTDSATAARYGMVVANLRNAAGRFVAPTNAALLASAQFMLPSSVPGVLVADPATGNAAAYPLPLITYAATAPNILNPTDAKSFADFVRYAVGAGQTPGVAAGTLPAGYVPLPTALRTAAIAAAKAIEARKPPSKGAASPTGSGRTSTPGKKPNSNGTSTSGNTSNKGSTSSPGGSPGPGETLTGGPPLPTTSTAPGPQSGPSGSPTSSIPPIALRNSTNVTPADPAGRGRYALAIALLLGVSASLFGPSLPRLARRLRQ